MTNNPWGLPTAAPDKPTPKRTSLEIAAEILYSGMNAQIPKAKYTMALVKAVALLIASHPSEEPIEEKVDYVCDILREKVLQYHRDMEKFK